MTAAVRVVRLAKRYGKGEALVRAVDDVDLEVAAGEAVVVTGPSGCGKSTLLQLMGGLDRPDAGEVWIAGQRIDRSSERDRAHSRVDSARARRAGPDQPDRTAAMRPDVRPRPVPASVAPTRRSAR